MSHSITPPSVVLPYISNSKDEDIEPNGKIPFRWEELDEKTYRARVVNGWLVRSMILESISVIFVPDYYHRWEI